MAQTQIAVQTVKGPVFQGQPVAASLAIAMTAADIVNGNAFVSVSGHETILVQNTAGSAGTVTVTSVPDNFGRSEDITAYSIPAAGIIAIKTGEGLYANATTGQVNFMGSAVTVLFAVLNV